MPVIVHTRRKFTRLARARIELGLDALTRLIAYNEKHPAKELFDAADVIIVNQVRLTLSDALVATVIV